MDDDRCLICQGPDGDAGLLRVGVWEDRLWRVTTSLFAEHLGFSYLEPKRHIPYITDLDGEEAATLGPTLARVSASLKEVTGAELVFVLVFGGTIPHLHLHLVPFRPGDPEPELVPGDKQVRILPNGLQVSISKDFPPLPEDQLREAADRIRERLARPP